MPKSRSTPRPANLSIASQYKKLTDPDRRRFDGSIVQVQGLSGMTTGSASVVFDSDGATLVLGDVNRPFQLVYSDILHVQLGGRGHFTTTKGGGWVVGGIGTSMTSTAAAMIEGSVLAAIANALTTRTAYHTASLIHLGWNSGSLTVLNTVMPPQQWNSVLGPVFGRIDAARQKPRAISAEKTCPFCAETIKAAAIKCRHCGSDIG